MDIKKPETYSDVVSHSLVHYLGPFSSIQSGLGELWAKNAQKPLISGKSQHWLLVKSRNQRQSV